MNTAGVPSNGLPVVSLVQTSGEQTIRYTPLAAMSIAAAVRHTPGLGDRVSVMVHDHTQAWTTAEMVEDIVREKPVVVGLSCQGWNMCQTRMVLSSLKQFLPDCTVVIGGTHVSGCGEKLLPALPSVDIVVNGEGEQTFPALLSALLDDSANLSGVSGISYRDAGSVVTTGARPPIRDLAALPDPYDVVDDLSLYDIALVETNRGCPYQCSYCYWGGRIGSKIARSPQERFRSILERLGQAGVKGLFLCDANFGILKEDEGLTEIIVETFVKYGQPSEINFNIAKVHADRVGRIIRRLQDAGLHLPVNVPVQTGSAEAYGISNRSMTGLDDMLAVADSLIREGREVYCEMIFGLPGESLREFEANYDILFRRFPNLRIHPLWILPNTDLDQRREELKIKTIRPDPYSDYEAVISHEKMSQWDIRDGLALLLSHSILNLLGSARTAMRAYALLCNGSVVSALSAFEKFLRDHNAPLAGQLTELYVRLRRVAYFERGLRARKRELLYRSREETRALVGAFAATLTDDPAMRDLMEHLVKYDCFLLPRSDLSAGGFVDSEERFPFDVVAFSRVVANEPAKALSMVSQAAETRVVVRHRSGLAALDGRNCDLTGAWNGRVIEAGAP